jgi:GcrA cell cycle regulator
MSWNDDRIEQLKQLWDKGVSASQIAEQLGGGITRNAVIGKAHRLGLKARPSPVKSEPGKKAVAAASTPASATAAASTPTAPPPVAAAPAAAPTPASTPTPSVARAPEPASAPLAAEPLAEAPAPAMAEAPKKAKAAGGKATKVTLLDLNDKICKWPIGHPGDEDFHFCGKPVNPGTPYCLEHCAVAYQAQLPRRDKRPSPLPMPRYRV